MIKCKHFTDTDRFMRGLCSLGKANGNPSYGHCIHNCKICSNTNEELSQYIRALVSPEARAKVKAEQEKQAKILKKFTISDRELIKQAGKHLLKVAKHALKTGKILATEQEINIRLSVCKTDCKEYDSVKELCKKCGCSLNGPVLNKAKYLALGCPIGKW